MRARSLLILAVLGLFPQAHVAWAHDHVPPDATIQTRDKHRAGRIITSCWIRGSEQGGAALCRQEETTFPKPIKATRAAASLAFDVEREPSRVRVKGWRELPAEGRPDYMVRRLEGLFDPTGRGWVAVLDLPRRSGDWFLEAKGVWPDANFPEDEQFAVWTFALQVP